MTSQVVKVARYPSHGEPAARRVEQVMGMPVSLALRGRHAHTVQGQRAWDEVVQQLRAVDQIFSTYREDSVVCRLDRGELTLSECPDDVHEVLALGEQAERQSGGAFSVNRADGAGRRRLDPSGVVKGWAVDRAAMLLRGLDETDFCLSAGGDMVCRAISPLSPPWRIGIEHPHNTRRLVAVVPVWNGAVATSGTAHRGQHLVDARTDSAPDLVASVTVIWSNLTWADIDATAAYAHGRDAARWLRGRPARTGLVVWSDGRHEIIRSDSRSLQRATSSSG